MRNEGLRPFKWTRTAGEILANIARFRKRTLQTGHWQHILWRNWTLLTASQLSDPSERSN